MLLNITCFFSKSWRNVLIYVVSVSLIIFKNDPCKIFSSNLKKAPFSLLSHKSKRKWWRTELHTVKSNMVFTYFSSRTFYISEDRVLSPGNSEDLWLLTALWLLWFRGLSAEEQAHYSASERYFNYINGGWLSAFCQK